MRSCMYCTYVLNSFINPKLNLLSTGHSIFILNLSLMLVLFLFRREKRVRLDIIAPVLI